MNMIAMVNALYDIEKYGDIVQQGGENSSKVTSLFSFFCKLPHIKASLSMGEV